MYSLLYSLIVSCVLFGIIHYLDKRENINEPYDMQKHLLTSSNVMIFAMIFVSCVVLFYFAFDGGDLLTSLGIYEDDHKHIDIKDPVFDVKKKSVIDPSMLKRINDPLKYGFEPYSGGSDMSSNDASSVSSSGSSDTSDSSSSDASE